MATAGNYNSPPPFDEKPSYKSWKKEIEIWRRITNLDKKKQALAVTLALTGRAKETALEIPADDLENDSGMDLLIATLDSVFLKEKDQTYTEFDCERGVTGPPAVDVEQNPAAAQGAATSNTELVSDGPDDESDKGIQDVIDGVRNLGIANDEQTVRIVGIHKVLRPEVYLYVEVNQQVKTFTITPALLVEAFGITTDLKKTLKENIPVKAVVKIEENTISSITIQNANDEQTVRIVGIHKEQQAKVYLHVEVPKVKTLTITPARLANAFDVRQEELEETLKKKIPVEAVVEIEENTISSISLENANDENAVRIVGIHKDQQPDVDLCIKDNQLVKTLTIKRAQLVNEFKIIQKDLKKTLKEKIPVKALVEIEKNTISSITIQRENDEQTVRIVGIHKVLRTEVYLHVEIPQVKTLAIELDQKKNPTGITKQCLEENVLRNLPVTAVVKIRDNTITSINPQAQNAND